jgi:hypothetical protein
LIIDPFFFFPPHTQHTHTHTHNVRCAFFLGPPIGTGIRICFFLNFFFIFLEEKKEEDKDSESRAACSFHFGLDRPPSLFFFNSADKKKWWLPKQKKTKKAKNKNGKSVCVSLGSKIFV